MREPVSCAPATPVRIVLDTMHRRRIGSMVVTSDEAMPLGIFTLRDVLDRVALVENGHDRPISSVMSTDLQTLPPHATVYEAVLTMLRHGIRHVVVVNEGKLAGLISEKDLFALQPVSMRHLAGAIRTAENVERLVELSVEMRAHVDQLLLQGTAPEPLMQLNAGLSDLLTQRVLDLGFSDMDTTGLRLCWIALGSEGRREQTLLTDQDNGIIFSGSGDPDALRRRLLPHAQRVNETLARCGFALCAGGIMAGNPAWCLTLAEWEQKFADWIERGSPQALLHGAIFFDLRPIHGERTLADTLRRGLMERIAHSPRFLHQMAANALSNHVPLGVFGGFSTSRRDAQLGTLDLKLNGAMLFVDAARIYALAAGLPQTNTCDRLREYARVKHVSALELQAWIDAFLFVQLLRLRHQHEQKAQGRPVSNRVNPAELNELEKRILREALRQARRLQARLALDYQL